VANAQFRPRAQAPGTTDSSISPSCRKRAFVMPGLSQGPRETKGRSGPGFGPAMASMISPPTRGGSGILVADLRGSGPIARPLINVHTLRELSSLSPVPLKYLYH